MHSCLRCLLLLAALSFPAAALAAPVIDAPATLSFGNVAVGSASNLNLSIGNPGNMILVVTSISLSGADFSASTPSTPLNIPPGGLITFAVTFAPTSMGPKTGSVTIASNDPITPSKVVSLSGLAVSPVISTSPASLAFGNVNVSGSANLTLAIGNDGNQNLVLAGMTFAGPDGSMFGFAGTPPSFPQNVPPGGQLMFSIRFTPTSAGAKSATLTVASNDPLQPNKAVSMSGTGIGPIISTTPTGALAFGEVHVAASSDLPVVITNAGGGTLTLSSFSITGSDAGSFSLLAPPALPHDLVSSATLSITLRFAPTTIGAKTATLQIASNDVSTPIRSIALSGTSIRPEPVIAGVKDVPNDQGGRVKLSWDASTNDTKSPPSVDHYWIFRSVPPQVAIASRQPIHSIEAGRVARARFYASRFRTETYYWELVDDVQALHFIQGYSHLVATTGDSTGAYNPLTVFMIMALDAANTVHWDSAPDSGYSVDNLPPTTPAPFTGSYFNGATHLHWASNSEADLAGYRIYRGSSADFVPSSTNLIGSPPDTGFTDAGDAGGYYRLSAVDRNGNESVFALLTPNGTVDVPGNGAMHVALAVPAPNPVVGEADLSFTLSRAGPATLAIYDTHGRLVRRVVHGPRPAGRQGIHWDGRRDDGGRTSEGVYFMKLSAEGRAVSVRFVLLR